MKQNSNSTSERVNAAPEAVADNVLNFGSTLRELRKNVDPNLVRQREGWRDRNGNVQMVDYVEWHTVADILDETAPNWAHTIKGMQQVGDVMTVTVAISIDGITREGIGTGSAHNEMGIKKAEHDALKRAAVKFGIARDLYKREFDAIERAVTEREGSERQGAAPANGHAQTSGNDEFPANNVAVNLSDLVTAKQLGMIRAISREVGVNEDEECNAEMKCKTSELSKKSASAFITHLLDMQQSEPAPLRRAG